MAYTPAALVLKAPVDRNEAALVAAHAGGVQAQIIRYRLATDRDDQPVELRLLRAVGVLEIDRNLPGCDLRAGHPGAQADVQSLGGEFLVRNRRDGTIRRRQEFRQRLQQRHLAAQARPHAAQFQADHARADDAQARRHGREIERAGRIDDVFAIDRRHRQRRRPRAGRDQDVLRGHGLHRAVGGRHLHLAIAQQARRALQPGDAVFLEKTRDAAGELARRSCPCGPPWRPGRC